jgi:(S)-2-hydroxyglutarate dehydrogenase
MNSHHTDVLIVGGGMVGLCIAHQLIDRGFTSSITVLDKEPDLGRHSSGRNSGVLHAGLYYKPGTRKAQVCVAGARRLKAWVCDRGLTINPCGKVIVPQRAELDSQLDVLAERGKANGAQVELLDSQQLRELLPEARSASGRALWSPNTAVVKPINVVHRLHQELVERGVCFMFNSGQWQANPEHQYLEFKDGSHLNYGHLFNCSGLQADRLAHCFGVGCQYILLPTSIRYLTWTCPSLVYTSHPALIVALW